MKEKCLLMGGGGFIGLNLYEHFKNSDLEVTVIDNLANANISAVEIIEPNKLIYKDVLNVDFMISFLKEFDYVINLCNSPIIDNGFFQQEYLLTSNVLTTQLLLQAASHVNLKKIILCSNMHVYGETKPYRSKCHEKKETNPINPVGSIKLSEEIIAKTLAQAYEQKICILRISECFGENMKINMPHSDFMRMVISCLTNTECTLPNDGGDTRDFIYIQDVCKYIEKIIPLQQDKLIEIYNICSGENISFYDMFSQIKNYTQSNNEIKFKPVIYPFAGHIIGDNTKIEKEVGAFKTPTSQSLPVTIEWIKKELELKQSLLNSTKQDHQDLQMNQ